VHKKVLFKDFYPKFWQKIELDFLPKLALKIFIFVFFSYLPLVQVGFVV